MVVKCIDLCLEGEGRIDRYPIDELWQSYLLGRHVGALSCR